MFGNGKESSDAGSGGDSAPIREALDQLERYWQQIRVADRLPARTDVDPARIDACLPHSFIVERVAPGVLRLRVAGSRLSEALGMEVRGMPLSALFLPEGRDVLARRVDAVFDGPAIMEFAVRSPRGLGKPLMAGRLLFLPLVDRDGQVTRALGAMITDGAVGRGGRRFTIDADAPIRCDPALSAPSKAAVAASRDSAEQDPLPRLVARSGLPRLRLVVDNTL